VVSLESVPEIRTEHGRLLRGLEWAFTVLFTVEYVLRLLCATRAVRYAVSFFGWVDLLAILPTYLSGIFVGTQSLTVIRVLRLLRVFRILKLVHFEGEARVLGLALLASGRKITVFLGTVVTLVLIIGSLMYLIEGDEAGFTSIPQSTYWAIVTLTTVGYGDIAPLTAAGKFLASIVMLLGYGIIAVPTGIVTAELAVMGRSLNGRTCPDCKHTARDPEARFCNRCGRELASG
jgi:voltage-gated potassium channel